ncbi:MAG: beta-N-acetylhexosaminidase [Bacteroidetes bacterium MedPE-SWsnd-G2]|nr:MAG: beta-N-acetylhexosaminidase [Bacteroidetes bacterium MedPE-SWsnd-G2]
MQFKTPVLGLFLIVLFGCSDSENLNVNTQIIPEPQTLITIEGLYSMASQPKIYFDEGFKIAGGFLLDYINGEKTVEEKENAAIRFLTDHTIKNPEAYKLEINEQGVTIKSNSDHGAFYAVQSLRQLLPVDFESGQFEKEIKLPFVNIEDAPAFEYRGMHLDVSRHFYSVTEIKKYIDAMAMLKLNKFHWHLTDDQGWRLEIKKYPKLQQVASKRDKTLLGHYSDQPHQFDEQVYGGFYTQEEAKEVVAYAQSKFITVIPEIELPGHSQAAVAAYPYLGCGNPEVNVATKWGVFETIYCTKEETFKFLADVMDEVIEVFPSQYIHIGGDEAPKSRWKSCEDCQNRIKTEALAGEEELQSYFVSRIESYLNKKGRQIIGWDEILEGGLAPNATVMSWRGFEGGLEAAKAGHQVIMSPNSNCYFDYYQSENESEPIAIGGFLPLQKVFEFNPIPEELKGNEDDFIIGGQANVWTEYMASWDKVEYMVFPRILAMSEALWSAKADRNYDKFLTKIEPYFQRLDQLDINYANHLFDIKDSIYFHENNTIIKLHTEANNKKIRYTIDGSIPTIKSELYIDSITVKGSKVINAIAFSGEETIGNLYTKTFNAHKAQGKPISLSVEPHKAYNTGGKQALNNGVAGSNTRYGDKEWLGFFGDDVSVTIDLKQTTAVTELKTRCFNGNGQWIYLPKSIEVTLDSGQSFTQKISPNSNTKAEDIVMPLSGNTRFLKIKITNFGEIPVGSQGEGSRAWLFLDELTVN